MHLDFTIIATNLYYHSLQGVIVASDTQVIEAQGEITRII